MSEKEIKSVEALAERIFNDFKMDVWPDGSHMKHLSALLRDGIDKEVRRVIPKTMTMNDSLDKRLSELEAENEELKGLLGDNFEENIKFCAKYPIVKSDHDRLSAENEELRKQVSHNKVDTVAISEINKGIYDILKSERDAYKTALEEIRVKINSLLESDRSNMTYNNINTIADKVLSLKEED